MKKHIQKHLKNAEDSIYDLFGEKRDNLVYAKEELQAVLDDPEADEEAKSKAKEMMHQVIDELAEIDYC